MGATIDRANGKSDAKRRKKKKESLVKRFARRGRETAGLLTLLVKEPSAFLPELLRRLKRGFRVVWSARGGGLYACGFIVTFVYLEIATFAGEIAAAEGVGSFLSEQLFEFFIRFTLQSLENTVYAFLWPLAVLNWSEVWGAVLLVALYIVFPRFLKKPLTAWLFKDDDEAKDFPDDT